MNAASGPPPVGGAGPTDGAGPRALAAGVIAGAIALLLYSLTASRYVGSHDAAQFQTLARTGGIAHAGYPLLIMLLELFDRLPLFTLPFRANLLSVLSGAVVVAAAAWSGARLAGRAEAGVLAALGLALSLTFWKEATHAGVHVFTLALGVAAFQLALRISTQPTGVSAFALGLLGGLGLVSHLTILALAPVGVAAFAFAARARRLRARHVVLTGAGLLLGLAPLLYLLAHDRPGQPMNYIHDTLRPDNATELSGGDPPVGRVARAAWLLSARQYLGGFIFSPFDDTPRRLRDLTLGGFMNQFPLWGIPLALWGAWVLWRRRDRAGLFLGLWLGGTLFWVAYGAYPEMVPIFFLPGLWVASQLLAVALGALAARSRAAIVAAGLLLVLTPFARLTLADPPGPIARAGVLRGLWHFAPREWDPFTPDTSWDAYGRGVMRTLPPRAVVLACWEEATTLRYFRYAEPLREDVDVHYNCLAPRPAFAAADSAGRPIFTTYAPTLEMTGGRAFGEVGRWARGGLWRIEGPTTGGAAPSP